MAKKKSVGSVSNIKKSAPSYLKRGALGGLKNHRSKAAALKNTIKDFRTLIARKLLPVRKNRVLAVRPLLPKGLQDFFKSPKSPCERRRERKEVLFAKAKVGSGRAIHTKKTYTQNSKVRC